MILVDVCCCHCLLVLVIFVSTSGPLRLPSEITLVVVSHTLLLFPSSFPAVCCEVNSIPATTASRSLTSSFYPASHLHMCKRFCNPGSVCSLVAPHCIWFSEPGTPHKREAPDAYHREKMILLQKTHLSLEVNEEWRSSQLVVAALLLTVGEVVGSDLSRCENGQMA